MRKSFTNKTRVECLFTDEGVSFFGNDQDVFYPYGSLDTLNMSLLGVLQASSGHSICCFAVERYDRAAMKEALKFAKEAMKTAPRASVQVVDKTGRTDPVPSNLPPEEQLKQYKALFIQGVISKEEYDARKRQLKDI